jgi:predicted enzyme related to lactoylglutathione lyase
MLANAYFETTLPVVDFERAKKFYMEALGLRIVDEPAPGMVRFASGEGTHFALYERATPTVADHTVGGFMVDDVEETVRELSERGVVFEQYDMSGLKTDERGIATVGSSKGAWFKDTEGNILSIARMG